MTHQSQPSTYEVSDRFVDMLASSVTEQIRNVMASCGCTFAYARTVVKDRSIAGPAVWHRVDALQSWIEA